MRIGCKKNGLTTCDCLGRKVEAYRFLFFVSVGVICYSVVLLYN